jgi:hypothetical protein
VTHPPAEEISERSWSTQQSAHLEAITRLSIGGYHFTLRCIVVRDFYDHQSYATCESLVLTGAGAEWRHLTAIPYPVLACLKTTSHTPIWRLLQQDAADLLALAHKILEATL